MDLTLFPNKEEWGTGDEAMDNKLSIALKKTLSHLSYESISEFYFLGGSLKPRAYNPTFSVTIELVTKALFHLFNPSHPVDQSLKKLRGNYHSKRKIAFHFNEKDVVMKELRTHKKYRYKNQLDFSIQLQDSKERNPYVREELKRSTIELSVKIIFKDFKKFLNEESNLELFDELLFCALRGGKSVLLLEGFAEIWYDQDQIFSLSLMEF